MIITAIVLILLFCVAFFLTVFSLKRLKTEISLSYPFDLFFPKGGNWSIGYFLIVIIFLAALIFFMLRGNFYLSPA
jgi:hypothetical protein